MIKYRTITKYGEGFLGLNRIREKVPVEYVDRDLNLIWYTIPWKQPNIFVYNFIGHSDIDINNEIYQIMKVGRLVWYGVEAYNKEEFYNPEWRKKIEVEKFL